VFSINLGGFALNGRMFFTAAGEACIDVANAMHAVAVALYLCAVTTDQQVGRVGAENAPDISCCNATYPEKSIAGRCAFGADQGSCPMPRCPVACGECKICPEMSSLPF
jgi:hypothetical protein